MQELTLFDTNSYTVAHGGLRETAIDTRGYDPSWDEPYTPVKSDAGDIDKEESSESGNAIDSDFSVDKKILYALDESNKSKSDIALAMAIGETVFKIQPALDRLVGRGLLAREGNRYRRSSTEKLDAGNLPAVTLAPITTDVAGDKSDGGDREGNRHRCSTRSKSDAVENAPAHLAPTTTSVADDKSDGGDTNPSLPKPESKSEHQGEPSKAIAIEKVKPPPHPELKPGKC